MRLVRGALIVLAALLVASAGYPQDKSVIELDSQNRTGVIENSAGGPDANNGPAAQPDSDQYNDETNPQAAAMLAYVDALREKTSLPTLADIIDVNGRVATVSNKARVIDAAKIMKERRVTAVCVMGDAAPGQVPKIDGIFTSKDIVLRVIAAGLNPKVCHVNRVHTPHPDTAHVSMTIHDALKKMYSE